MVNQHENESFYKSAVAINGSITPKVYRNVIIMIIYSSIISHLNHYIPSIGLPVGPFEYAGLVMGLILVFRLNNGYDRWWEGRKIWGNIVNNSRNLAIIVMNYVPSTESAWKLKVTNYIAALSYLTKNYLRNNDSLDEIKEFLPTGLLEKLARVKHKPNFLFAEIAKELSLARLNGNLDDFAFMQAEQTRALLVDCQGACERIVNTPIPYVMAVKSRRFILLFLLALPFALVDLSTIINFLISGLVAYTLLSLDQIGWELQNPFSEDRLSHLPLGRICVGIQRDILEIQGA
jgi:putative membrane protein